MPTLSHINSQGHAQMVDVSQKASSYRYAKATASVVFPKAVFAQLQQQNFNHKKGGILSTAQIAGMMAAKKTFDLIPMCHPLLIEKCDVNCEVLAAENTIGITSEVAIHHKTGVEMEALTAASIAALTIYDMCKALSHDIEIGKIQLLEKTGGKHDLKR